MRKMKDSGLAWIGVIPENWDIRKYKYFTESGMGQTILKEDLEETGIPVFSATEDEEIFGFLSDPKVVLNYGDIVIPARGNSIGKVTFVKEPKATCTQTTIYSKVFNINNKFLYYCCNGLGFDWFKYTDTAIPQITVNQIRNNMLAVPPDIEQNHIVAYLDTKCARIDAIANKIRTQIEKFNEYKQTVITRTVTKGLNPSAPMKDSGVPWIGEIPASWNISSVRWEFDNLDGRRMPISADNRVSNEGLYDYYGASGVIDKIDSYIFDEDLILIGEDGANLSMRNLPLIYVARGKYWVNNHAHILRPKSSSDLKYMAYQLELVDLHDFITGSTQPKLTQNNLSKIPVIVPDIMEQQKIVFYLDAKCAKIDAAIAKQETLLTKVEEYKKSLIYECVTGKREVPAP